MMKSKPFISPVKPKVKRSCPGNNIETDGSQDEADQDRDQGL